MKREEKLLKQIYDYLDSEEEIATLRWVIDMIEDGFTWEAIKDHLENGCHCKELKGEEAKRALEAEL